MSVNGAVQIQPPPDYWKTVEGFREETGITIKLKDGTGNEFVGINLVEAEKLPTKQEILDILRDEEPPIRIWSQLALQYYIRGRTDVFLAILEEGRERISRGMKDANDTNVDQAFSLDLLANFYALKLVEKKGDKERKELSAKVMTLYSQVDRLFVYSQYHLVGRAFFCLLDQKKIESAVTQFDYVLLNAPTDALALQGRGIAAFHQGDFKKALLCFKKVLLHHPGCSADIRVGIGHCLFKLGYLDKARIAYNRAIQLDPACSEARIGLGLILWNEGTSSSLEKALGHIVHVHKKDVEAKRVNPVNLNILADHYFFRREPETALKLSMAAIQSSFNEILKAESAYSVGRSYHYREDYDQAFQYYYQATQFAKGGFVLPWFGLGQMYVERREFPNALQCFEKVLAVSPNNVETLRILGLLYLMVDVKEKRALARTYLKKVTELCHDDVDAHIKFAELQESIDPASALNTYLRVIQIFQEQSEQNETPPEILNNISCLYFNLGQMERSREFLDLARAAAQKKLTKNRNNENENEKNQNENEKNENENEKNENEIHFKAILTTMTYNHGRLLEELHETEEAENCFRSIAEGEQSKYIDCYLRYGCIARDKGNILKASDWFKEAAHANPDHPDSHLLLGNLHMAKGEFGPAQKKYEKVLDNPLTKTDTYALLSLGNIWLETLYQNIPDVEKKKRHAERAFMLYKQVLKLDPTNVYAVNGMGAVLARTGQLEEAKEMFSVVRESTADILDLWLNIGHSYCDQRQYVAGIKMYENALKRFKDASLDANIFLYLARAQYFQGDFSDARKTLQVARRLAPQNQQLRYNLAVVMKRMALLTFGDARHITNPTLPEVQGAVWDLEVAKKIFEVLSVEGDKAVVDLARAHREARKCADLILISEHKLKDAEENDKRLKTKRDATEAAGKQYQELLLKEQEEQEEQKRQQQEELLKRRQEVLERTNAVKEKIIREEAGDVFKPSKKRSRKNAGLEDDFIDEGGDNREPREPGQKRARGARGEGGEGGGDRKGRKAARRRRREERREQGLPLSSEDEGEEQGKRRTNEPEYDRKGRRLKSAAFISDTDSSTSDSDSDSKRKEKRAVSESGSEKASRSEKAGFRSGSEKGSGSEKASGSRSEKGARAKAKRALASTDEEDGGGATVAAASGDEDVEKTKPKRAKRAALFSDDDEEEAGETDGKKRQGNEGEGEGDEDEGEGMKKRAKLSVNESDSDF